MCRLRYTGTFVRPRGHWTATIHELVAQKVLVLNPQWLIYKQPTYSFHRLGFIGICACHTHGNIIAWTNIFSAKTSVSLTRAPVSFVNIFAQHFH